MQIIFSSISTSATPSEIENLWIIGFPRMQVMGVMPLLPMLDVVDSEGNRYRPAKHSVPVLRPCARDQKHAVRGLVNNENDHRKEENSKNESGYRDKITAGVFGATKTVPAIARSNIASTLRLTAL